MCGIAGAAGIPLSREAAQRMLQSMARRGPDGSGSWCREECSLLHRRLSVIDPEGGAQPMVLTREDEQFVIVYNGELYNTPQLRRELEALGHRFRSHSDTEVLLHAYAAFGEDCLEKLNGIYAFGVWEKNRRRLFLARDRIGVKPLFYAQVDQGLLFASEMKTLLASGLVTAALDPEGAAQLLLLGPGRLPGSGVFHGIRELEPGCCASWEEGRMRLRRYWQLRDREHRETFEETSEQVRTLVTDAVLKQTVSDVPIGCFLSGGLDSSIITALCARAGEAGAPLKTFSVDYQDNDLYFTPGKFQPDSDGTYIRLMEQTFSTDHSRTVLSPEELDNALEAATRARDLPGMGDVDFSLLCFCGRIREDVKVALSGECADEIFGGYPWYRDPEIRDRAGFPWAQNTAQRAALLSPALRSRIDGEAFVAQAYADTCAAADVLPGTAPSERRMKELVNLNFRWFMQTLLDRKDRMSMYHSLEVRVPFCDHRIAQYLYGVPWAFKDWQGREKGLLRHAFRDLLPERILWRKKSPYPKTFHPEYARRMDQRLERLLREKNSPLLQLLDPAALKSLLREEQSWPWYGQLMKRPQTVAYILQLECWLRLYGVRFLF